MTKVDYWRCDGCEIEVPQDTVVKESTSWIQLGGDRITGYDAESAHHRRNGDDVVIKLSYGQHFCSFDCLLNKLRSSYDKYISKKTVGTLENKEE